jgi:hypothetical protein
MDEIASELESSRNPGRYESFLAPTQAQHGALVYRADLFPGLSQFEVEFELLCGNAYKDVTCTTCLLIDFTTFYL